MRSISHIALMMTVLAALPACTIAQLRADIPQQAQNFPDAETVGIAPIRIFDAPQPTRLEAGDTALQDQGAVLRERADGLSDEDRADIIAKRDALNAAAAALLEESSDIGPAP